MRASFKVGRDICVLVVVCSTLTCSEATAPPPTLSVSSTSFAFAGVEGSSSPAGQVLSITNTGGGTLSWSAVSSVAWLSVTPSSGSAPSSVTVTPNISGLTAGTHTGAITITSSGATNSPMTIAATLALSAPPAIGLAATTFTFTGQQGAANPPNQTLNISNTGGGTLNWTASKGSAWLTLTPASGTGTGAVTLTVSTIGLTAGTYNDVISVTAPGASNSPATASVTLTVTVPPGIGMSPTSFAFTGQQGGANPANQTLNLSNTGGGTLTWTASDDAGWLTLSPTSGTGPGAVTLSVNTSGLTAGSYNGVITIGATGASNTPATANVTLTVTPNHDGAWAGTTAQDSTITFQVQNSGITTVTFGWKATGSGCTVTGKTTTNFTTAVPITNGSFSRSVSGSPTSYTIAGTFSSGTAASGTLTIDFSQSIPGVPSCTASGSTTWNAAKP